jgi:small-conductance mechanosensitive channel
MPRLKKIRDSNRVQHMFETKSHAWQQVGIARELSRRAAKRARIEMLVLLPMLAGVLLLYTYRDQVFGLDEPVRVGTVIALVALGWAFARDVGRLAGPALFRRMDPATAGTVGFLIRLFVVGITLLVALRIAGLEPRTLAVGGAFTAVIVGLAAQQTLGNLIAGMVLLSARPFRVGERVRLQAGGVAGSLEGVVSSLGLLYTTLAQGDDRVMVPNSVVLNAAIMPLREPDRVDLRAHLRAGVLPSEVQAILEEAVTVPTRGEPHIALEEVHGDEVIVRVTATPQDRDDGPRLADEILIAIADLARDREVESAASR